MQLKWVSKYINIRGNKLADKAVKKETKLYYIILKSYISMAFIKRKIKKADLIN